MSLKLKRKKVATIPPLDGGTYIAVCVGIVDIGEQYNSNYKNYANKLMLLFEIPSETVEVDGQQKPRWLSKEYTASLNEKSALFKHLTSWRAKQFSEAELSEDGDGFDVKTMIGQPCMLTVTVKDTDSGKYNRIENISALPKGIPAPETDTEQMVFDIDDRDQKVFDALPEWIQNKIKKSTEYAGRPPEEHIDLPPEDEPESPDPQTSIKQTGGDRPCPF